jgi:hypothetical protein
MTDLSDVVYSITAHGFTALRASDSAGLTPQLRTVLTVVDGVCPVAQYEPFLRAFMPLTEKFQILEQLGYLRRLGAVSDDAVKLFNQTAHDDPSVSHLPRIDADRPDSGFTPLI